MESMFNRFFFSTVLTFEKKIFTKKQSLYDYKNNMDING